MKLKTRIIVGFLMVILVPLLLFTAALYGFQRVQSQDTPQVNSNIVYDFSIENDADGGARVSLMAKDVLFSALVILVFTSGEAEAGDPHYKRRQSGFRSGCGRGR